LVNLRGRDGDEEASALILNGAPETARLMLRDFMNATMGFEQTATPTAKLGKHLHRMLSPTRSSRPANLAEFCDL